MVRSPRRTGEYLTSRRRTSSTTRDAGTSRQRLPDFVDVGVRTRRRSRPSFRSSSARPACRGCRAAPRSRCRSSASTGAGRRSRPRVRSNARNAIAWVELIRSVLRCARVTSTWCRAQSGSGCRVVAGSDILEPFGGASSVLRSATTRSYCRVSRSKCSESPSVALRLEPSEEIWSASSSALVAELDDTSSYDGFIS